MVLDQKFNGNQISFNTFQHHPVLSNIIPKPQAITAHKVWDEDSLY